MEPAIPNGGASAGKLPMAPVVEAPAMVREQDRLMPIANVIRIMRRVLPSHAKISDDAKEVIQECVSEFISFITGEANDRCHHEHRKTVTAEDLVWAMERLGFDNYVVPLGVYLRRMRESEGGGGGRAAPVRGDRTGADARAPQPLAPNEDALHYVPVQQAAYAPPDLSQRYAMPVRPAGTLQVGGQRKLFGGGSPMAAYYGGMPFGEGSSRVACAAEEGSSTSASPAPPAGTEFQAN